MFCSNCGNRVPDGSNFCSACGTRLAVAVEAPVVEPIEMPLMQERNRDFSFDWSGVKDEPHKKEVREVASPWGASGMNTETVAEEEQRSRTMSFIDILKKEREEKARAAEAEPVVVVDEYSAPKHASHSEMPSFYEPPMYEDLNSHTVTPFDNMEDEEPAYEEPVYEAPAYEEPQYEAPKFETVDAFDPAMEELNISVEPEEPTIVLDGSEFVSDGYDEDSNKARLDAELAAILDAGSGKPAGEEDDSVDLFEDTEEIDFPTLKAEETVEEEPVFEISAEEPAYEEPVEEEPVLKFEPSFKDETTGVFDYEALIAELNDLVGTEPTETLLADYIDEPEEFAEQVEAEETVEEPVVETVAEPEEDEYVPTHGSSVVEEPEEEVEEEFEEEESLVEAKDAEIDELKKRLAELMGETVEEEPVVPVEEPAYEEPAYEAPVYEAPVYEEPVFEEPAPVVEEEEPVTEPAVEIEEDQPFFEALGISVPTEELVEEESEPEVEEIEEAVEEEPKKDGPIVEHFSWFADDAAEETEEEPVVEEELPLIDPTPDTEEVLPLINEEHEEAVIAEEHEEAVEDDSTDAMSVEELERDLFGEVAVDDAEAEATKKIDKFYTLYKKNEEFQRLLDEEYNKLKMEEEVVPTVSAILDEAENAASEAVEEVTETAQEVAAPAEAVAEKAEEIVEEVSSAIETVAKEDAASDEEASGKGGTALTIIAVIVAVLLVVLLAIILVLNFAPDSAIALKLDSVIEVITSYFSAVEVPGNFLL